MNYSIKWLLGFYAFLVCSQVHLAEGNVKFSGMWMGFSLFFAFMAAIAERDEKSNGS